LPDGLDGVSWELPHDDFKYDGGDSYKDGSILEGNGELIFCN
jgi:hypothetical protein